MVRLPGAAARLIGTINLQSANIKFKGNLATRTDLSHMESGWTSLLLKPLAPFFRRKRAGAVVPIVVQGTAMNPKVQGDVF